MDVVCEKVVKDAHRTGGSALIMVVVLTVLLAAIGILFVMASRVDEMASSAVVRGHELDCAVESVVELISHRLSDDIASIGQENYDYPRFDPTQGGDMWLAPIEPRLVQRDVIGLPESYQDDYFRWTRLSDITGTIPWWQARWGFTGVDVPADANDLLPADADGDGIIDSLWTRMLDISSSRGEPIFAAVRIVDNCGMLNLNTAHVYIDSLSGTPPNNRWPVGSTDGKYLSSVDYFRFLRGQDMLFRLRLLYARDSRGPVTTDQLYHENVVMNIENPPLVDLDGDGMTDYVMFDISDELEIRNRFMLTSSSLARFEREDIGYWTFDYGRGDFPGAPGFPELKVRRMPYDDTNFNLWKARLDPYNFDDMSGAYVDPTGVDYRWYYDRRHVCTFYSFDRNMRTGVYPAVDQGGRPGCNPVTMIFEPDVFAASTNFHDRTHAYNSIDSREKVLRMLYALRAYYLVRNPAWDYKQAARRAAQTVANMIDYTDDNDPASPEPGPFALQVPDMDGDLFDYGGQTNDNPTFIDRRVIRNLIMEVSKRLYGRPNMIDIDASPQYEFGLGVQDDRETVYGYERQAFISEITRYDGAGGSVYYAIELCNPYENPNGTIYLDTWQIKIGSSTYPLASSNILNGACEVEPATIAAGVRQLGRAVIVDDAQIVNPLPPCNVVQLNGMTIPNGQIVELQRADPRNPGEFITVDWTRPEQADEININNAAGTFRSSKRDDDAWKFANAAAYTTDNSQTLGLANGGGTKPNSKAWQMPVKDDNEPIGTLLDFERVLTIGNEQDPNYPTNGSPTPITEQMASATVTSEKDVRNDVEPVQINMPFPQPSYSVSILDYVCFMDRPEGSLPGRININTATKEVIRAAIPPNLNGWTTNYDRLARNIVDYREPPLPPPYVFTGGKSFKRISDLLNVTGFQQLMSDPNGVGDPDMRGDIEERDWILSTVANIFTVRSDVFTAYILVRVGHDGPQRRMIAIFDRTNVDPITQKGQKVQKPRLIALHPVPDPR